MKNINKKTLAVAIATVSTTTLISNHAEASFKHTSSDINLLNNSNQSVKQYQYLSDIEYIKNLSSTGYGPIKLDQNLDGDKITLNVDGEVLEFSKGIAAHATSTVVFDVSSYSNTYSRFTTYVGLDRSRGNNGNGVKFKIMTSNDGKTWEEKAESPILNGNDNALFIDIDITGAKYLKLYAHDNGDTGYDHAVYAAPRIMLPDYDISSEYLGGILNISDYDKLIQEKYEVSQQLTDEIKQLLLKRTFTKRVGFYTLQKNYR